jgi:hypothetical protein
LALKWELYNLVKDILGFYAVSNQQKKLPLKQSLADDGLNHFMNGKLS